MDTPQFITQLASISSPVKTVRPWVFFILWIIVAVGCNATFVAFSGLRPDFEDAFFSWFYRAELLSLIVLAVTSAISATLLSYPDGYQKKWLVYAPILMFAVFSGILFLSVRQQEISPPLVMIMSEHTGRCMLVIMLLSLVPAAVMFYILHRQAPTQRRLSGFVTMLSATSLACFSLRLSEKTNDIAHIIEWHYIPIILFGLLGIWIGKIFLRW